jgi:hypothetical protein
MYSTPQINLPNFFGKVKKTTVSLVFGRITGSIMAKLDRQSSPEQDH